MDQIKNYYYENEEIVEIYNHIINEGVNNKRKYYAAGILITLLFLVIFMIIYLIKKLDAGINLNLISIILGLIGVSAFTGFILFIIKEDNRKYRYHKIQEETIREGLKNDTISKKIYNKYINEKFTNSLISNKILKGTNKDLDILDFHIQKYNNVILEKQVNPFFIKGNVAFFILFITIAVQIILLFYQKYEKIDSILLSVSILILLISLSVYSIFFIISIFYKDINNKKINTLKRIVHHLEIIKLKRLHEDKTESKLKKIIDILIH